MFRPLELTYRAVISLFLLGLCVWPEGVATAASEPQDSLELVHPEGEGVLPLEDERHVETLEQKGGFLGYRLLDRSGYGGRAFDYGFLHSGKQGGLFYRHLQKDESFELEGEFLNEKEYHGDLVYDYRGDYRVHLRTESLFHNLDRQLLFSPQAFEIVDPSTDPATVLSYSAQQQDPRSSYGVGVAQDLATFRYRLHNFPLHLNLGYWRLVREGTMQQRFGDVSFVGSPNILYAAPRAIDRQTHQGTLGLDAHLGWLDLIYEFQIRQFADHAPIPVAHYQAEGAPDPRLEADLQHNEDPDSRLISHTVKLHSTLSDGIVGSASYSVSQRENRSRLSDTRGVRGGRTTLHNAAGDFSYTPCHEFSLALKYRRQEVEPNRFGLITNPFFTEQRAQRPSVGSTTDLVVGTFSFRPGINLSLTAEYRGELVTRSNVAALPAPIPDPVTWGIPDKTLTHTGTLALFYRPLRGARLSAKYSYQNTDDPAYGSSFEQRHQGELLATYTGSKKWGVSANLIQKREWNDQVRRVLFSSLDPVTLTRTDASARQRTTQNANLSLWFAPLEYLTITANCAHLRNVVDQQVVFMSIVPDSLAGSTFKSHSYVYGVNTALTATDKLSLNAGLQQIFSTASFSPESAVFGPGDDTLGIRQITSQDTAITQFSLRGEYRFSKELASSLEYTLRDYNESNPVYSGYNGTVHAVVASLSTTW